MIIKNVIILALILIFWFLLSTTLFYMGKDTELARLSLLEGNTSSDFSFDSSALNITSVTVFNAPTSIGNAFFRIFTFRIPTGLVPKAGGVFLSFFNFLLFGVALVMVYKIILPTVDG